MHCIGRWEVHYVGRMAVNLFLEYFETPFGPFWPLLEPKIITLASFCSLFFTSFFASTSGLKFHRFCINFGAIVIFCAWNRKRNNMTHCCYIFSVRLKLIKTCFDLLKSSKTRLGLFQINFQNTKWKSKLGLHRHFFLQFHQRKKV